MLNEKTMVLLDDDDKKAIFVCPENKQELTKEELGKLIGMMTAAYDLMDCE